MDITGLVNTGSNSIIFDALFNTNSKKALEDVTSQLESLTEQNTDTAKDYSSDIVDPQDSAAISDFAGKLSAVDRVLKASGNTEAEDGLREIAKQFASKPANFGKFMDSVSNLDDSSFQKVFSTADKLADKGVNVGKFTDALSSISDETKAKSFLDDINKALDNAESDTSGKIDVNKSVQDIINKIA